MDEGDNSETIIDLYFRSKDEYSLSKNEFSFNASTAPKRQKYDKDVAYTHAADTVDDILGVFFSCGRFMYLLLMNLMLCFNYISDTFELFYRRNMIGVDTFRKYYGLFRLVIFSKYGHSLGVQAYRIKLFPIILPDGTKTE